jgi:hypothetical protein
VRLGFPRQEAVAAGLTDPRARGGGFIERPRVLWHADPNVARRGRSCRGQTQCESEPGSSTRSGKPPIGGSRLSAREEGRRERACGLAGLGEAQAVGPVVPCGRKGGEGGKADWAWAAWKKKREGKEKERMGWAQREKEGEKEMHLNLNLKFKFN